MYEEKKERIIQEFVPGKQVTLAHVIPHPVEALYGKMGLIDAEGAIGIFTITPSEAAISRCGKQGRRRKNRFCRPF